MNDDTKPRQTLTIELWDDEDSTVATCKEQPGPIGEGTTRMEAITRLLERMLEP